MDDVQWWLFGLILPGFFIVRRIVRLLGRLQRRNKKPAS